MATTRIGSRNLGLRRLGAKHCQAVANGTSALITSGGIRNRARATRSSFRPYTFVATIHAVLMHHALPVFVDTDPETFQIDARNIEAAITEGPPAFCRYTLVVRRPIPTRSWPLARKHNLPVIEDACQAHLAEWRHKKVGTSG